MRNYETSLIDFCERLPINATLFTCRIGTGQSLHVFWKGFVPNIDPDTGEPFPFVPSDKDQIETFVYESMHEMVESLLQSAEDEGWGIEHDTIRIHAQTNTRTNLRSKVCKKDTFNDVTKLEQSSVQALTLANIRMSEEIRRTMREVANNQKEHLITISNLSQSLIESRAQQLELERENMARELVMEMHDSETGDNTREQGLSLLERIASGLFQQQAQNIDDIVKETIKNDPSKVREYCQDPEVVNAIRNAMFGMDDEE